ncbi:MAG: hypothetical protein JXR76_09445 [Deltaproteobacteria bacterium]|nr:hypothetical protein [Deltaproteobacteria bacterium]
MKKYASFLRFVGFLAVFAEILVTMLVGGCIVDDTVEEADGTEADTDSGKSAVATDDVQTDDTGAEDTVSDMDTEDTSTEVPLSAVIPFQISNVDMSSMVWKEPGELNFKGSSCEHHASINTDSCDIDCISSSSVQCWIMTQPDRSEVAIIYAKAISVAKNIKVTLEGQRPLILISQSSIFVDGKVEGSDSVSNGRGTLGGFSVDVGGPGKGERPLEDGGTGGGAYCGTGGDGGRLDDEYPGGTGGAPYGNAEIIPLQGGSSGGSQGLWKGGAGGGAIQLVAKETIEIGPIGFISLPGRGGDIEGQGGGSGGAVLLEAPSIAVKGSIAVNGGGGGGGKNRGGYTGGPNDSPAPGGVEDRMPKGGDGSAGKGIDGLAGENHDKETHSSASVAGGGGGGAGWIRLNTTTGEAKIEGIVSPSLETSCASIGTLK